MKKISLFIIFVLLSTSVAALGVIPSYQHIVYSGENNINITFSVVNTESKEVDLKIFTDLTELANDTILPNKITMKPDSEQFINLQIKLSKEYPPGNHRSRIFIQQISRPEDFLTGASSVGALPAVALPIELIVPREEKYLIGKFNPIRPINPGDPAYISLVVINIGNEVLFNVGGPIEIRNEQNKLITTIETTRLPRLEMTQENELRALWLSDENIIPGPYKLNAKIDYGGEKKANIDGSMEVGGKYIDILGLSTSNIKSNNIGKFVLNIKSHWNKDLEDVFADIIIKQGSEELTKIKTSSKTIKALQSNSLEAFWETPEIEPDTRLNAEITIRYEDKTTEKSIEFRADPALSPAQIKLWNSVNIILATVSIILIIICSILITRTLKNKK